MVGNPVTEQVTVTESGSTVTITNSAGNVVTNLFGNPVTTQLPYSGSLTESQCPHIGLVDWELICDMWCQLVQSVNGNICGSLTPLAPISVTVTDSSGNPVTGRSFIPN